MATFGVPLQTDAPRLPRSVVPPLMLLGVLVMFAIAAAGFVASRYNQLVRLDHAVERQWTEVENAFQRRSSLVPNLVQAVNGATHFEQQTVAAVTQARAQVGQPHDHVPTDATELEHYQQLQDQLGGALGRLLVAVQADPELTATQGFRDLQAQLEGTESRIAVERMRFNDAARAFNTARDSFPTHLVAGMFRARFKAKNSFGASEGASRSLELHF